jgi:hypothetical protein
LTQRPARLASALVRTCSKNGCGRQAESTVTLRYGPKEVVVVDLAPERDPNLIELCRAHADVLSVPLGWELADLRSARATTA